MNEDVIAFILYNNKPKFGVNGSISEINQWQSLISSFSAALKEVNKDFNKEAFYDKCLGC